MLHRGIHAIQYSGATHSKSENRVREEMQNDSTNCYLPIHVRVHRTRCGYFTTDSASQFWEWNCDITTLPVHKARVVSCGIQGILASSIRTDNHTITSM